MLNPSSRLKGEKDMEKYEKARRLKNKVAKIREDYTAGTILNINNLIH
jgi:DNA topoisomerase-1